MCHQSNTQCTQRVVKKVGQSTNFGSLYLGHFLPDLDNSPLIRFLLSCRKRNKSGNSVFRTLKKSPEVSTKGVKKSVLKNTISHDDYKTCLLDKKVHSRDMPGLRSYNHTIHGETVHKVALAPLDTKRYILDDGITTLAFGHKDIPVHTHKPHKTSPCKSKHPQQTTLHKLNWHPYNLQNLISHFRHCSNNLSVLYIEVFPFQSINQIKSTNQSICVCELCRRVRVV